MAWRDYFQAWRSREVRYLSIPLAAAILFVILFGFYYIILHTGEKKPIDLAMLSTESTTASATSNSLGASEISLTWDSKQGLPFSSGSADTGTNFLRVAWEVRKSGATSGEAASAARDSSADLAPVEETRGKLLYGASALGLTVTLLGCFGLALINSKTQVRQWKPALRQVFWTLFLAPTVIMSILLLLVPNVGGKAASSLLDRIEKGSTMLSTGDVTNLAAFVGGLDGKPNEISRCVSTQLDRGTLDALESYRKARVDTQQLRSTVARSLNKIIGGGPICAKSGLSESGAKMARQNRVDLDTAFPGAFSGSEFIRISYIASGLGFFGCVSVILIVLSLGTLANPESRENLEALVERIRSYTISIYSTAAVLCFATLEVYALFLWGGITVHGDKAQEQITALINTSTLAAGIVFSGLMVVIYLPVAVLQHNWLMVHAKAAAADKERQGKDFDLESWLAGRGLSSSPLSVFGSYLAILTPVAVGVLTKAIGIVKAGG